MIQLCSPALIYLIFSLTQILIDTIKGLYNTASMKIIVMVMVTYLLNVLCQRGLGVVSWIIVFVPFILMSVIVGMLLYVFGLDAATGKLNPDKPTSNTLPPNVSVDMNGDIIVYDPYYDPITRPVMFKSPNIIIPSPVTALSVKPQPNQPTTVPPLGYTSDPSYQN
jgi:hypothetical protein